MAVAEIHSELPARASLGERVRGSLELAIPDQKIKSVEDINSKELVANGITTVLVDGDSSIVEQGGWLVPPAIQKKFQELRNAGIQNIGIWSNNRPADDTGWRQVAWWGYQIGADQTFVPILLGDRKPEETMAERATEFFEVKPQETVMIGDKASADIVAGNRAGMHTILVDRLGRKDLLGDRLLRRPAEKIWGLIYPTLISGKIAGNKEVPPHLYRERPPVATIYRSLPPKDVVVLGLIHGFTIKSSPGGQDLVVELEDTILDQIVEPRGRTGQFLASYYEFMGQHGGFVADVQTLVLRPVLDIATTAAILKGKNRTAFWLNVASALTDKGDGYAAGLSDEPKDSPRRVLMGHVEAGVDHLGGSSKGAALAIMGLKRWRDFLVQTGRDVAREFQKHHYKKHHPHLDTRATTMSRGATFSQIMADSNAMRVGEMSSSVDTLHALTSALKVVSMAESSSRWRQNFRAKKIGKRTMSIMLSERIAKYDDVS